MNQQKQELLRCKTKLDKLTPGPKKLRRGQLYLNELEKQESSPTIRWIMCSYLSGGSKIPRGEAFKRLARLEGWFI